MLTANSNRVAQTNHNLVNNNALFDNNRLNNNIIDPNV
jgi:hypothetical protein